MDRICSAVIGAGQRKQSERFVDGFLRLGDLAIRDPDGMYHIVGRRAVDIIKSGGFKIGAVEIESCLQNHPAVAEVAVVGVSPPRTGARRWWQS